MNPVQVITQELLTTLDYIPLPDTSPTLELQAYTGQVTGQGIVQGPDLWLDRFALFKGTETRRRVCSAALTIDVYQGQCRIHIGTGDDKDIVLVMPGQPYYLKPDTPFVLKTDSPCAITVRVDK